MVISSIKVAGIHVYHIRHDGEVFDSFDMKEPLSVNEMQNVQRNYREAIDGVDMSVVEWTRKGRREKAWDISRRLNDASTGR